MVNALVVVELPAMSRICAESVYEPFASFRVSQAKLYGAADNSAESGWPLRKYWTLVMATLSAAFDVRVTVPDTVPPLVAPRIEPVGAVVSRLPPIGVLMSLRSSPTFKARL